MYGRFHDRQRDVEVLAALKCVVEAYGHFTALAIDNGRQFIAQTVMAAMAILGIKVRRARPYTPHIQVEDRIVQPQGEQVHRGVQVQELHQS